MDIFLCRGVEKSQISFRTFQINVSATEYMFGLLCPLLEQ